MYCSNCAAPLAAGISYCNRCGTYVSKDRDRPLDQQRSIAQPLVATVVLFGVLGIALVIGGSIALKVGAELHEPAVILYMILSFLVVSTVEMLLIRQLSRVLGKEKQQQTLQGQPLPLFQPALMSPGEARLPHLRSVPETIASVTENTTRTLEQSFKQ